MKKNILYVIMTAAIMIQFIHPVAVAQTYISVDVTGFNQKLIANGVGSGSNHQALATTSTTFDALGVGSSHVMYSTNFRGDLNPSTAPPYGLPSNGVITSVNLAGAIYNLESFTVNNTLLLLNSGDIGTLTLVTPGVFEKVAVLGSSASGASTFSTKLNFSDGTNATYSFSVPDWYGGASYAIKGIGRVNRVPDGSTHTWDQFDGDASNPRLYDNLITLTATDKVKILTSITFTKTSAGGRTAILAINGVTPEGTIGPTTTIAATNVTATSFTANWTAFTGATGYYLDVATNNTFTTYVTGFNNLYVSGQSTSSSSVTGLTLGVTYYYRVRVNNGFGPGPSSNTTSVITGGGSCINPTNGGVIASNQTGCTPFTPAAFTSTSAPTGHTGTLEFKWQSSVTSYSSGFTDISSSNSATYSSGALTQSTWFKRLARVTCKSDWTGAAESNVIAVTVYPSGQVNQPSNQDVNNGGTTTAVNFTTTQTGGTTTYAWTNNTPSIGLAATGSGNIASFIAVNTGSSPIVATIVVTPTMTNGEISCAGPTKTFTITVSPTIPECINPTNGGEIAANQTGCTPFAPAAFTSISAPTGQTGTLEYKWQSSTTSSSSDFSDISSSNSAIFTSGALTQSTWFKRLARVTCKSDWTGAAESNVIAVTVNPKGQVNHPESQAVCHGEATAAVVFETLNSGGTTVYTWTNDIPSIGLAASGTGNIASFIATNTTPGPQVATITVTPTYSNGGVSCSGDAKSFKITVNPLVLANQLASQVICNAAATTSVTFETTNTGGVSTYTWTNNTPSIGLAASGTGDIASFTAVNTGTAPVVATIVVTPTFTNAGISCTGAAKSFTLTVNPTAQVDQPASQVVCNTAATTAVSFGTVNTGGTMTYAWTNNNTSIGLVATGTGNISAFTAMNTGAAPAIATILVTPTFTNGSVSCSGPSKTFLITVNPTGQVNQPADQIVCNAASTTAVTFGTVNTGGTTTYTWTNNSPGIGLGASGTGSIPAFVAMNTGTAPVIATIIVTPTITNGSMSCSGPSKTFLITVNPTGQVNLPADQDVCSTMSTAEVTFGTVNTGGTTLYTWTNNNTSIGLGATGTGSIPAFVAMNTGTAPAIATITVTPTITNGSVSCSGPSKTFIITVNPLPIPTITGATSLCFNSGFYDYTTEPGMTGYVWTVSAGGTITYGVGTNQIQVKWNIASGAQSVSVSYTSPAGCSAGIPTNLPVTVNPIPGNAGTITGAAAVCGVTLGVSYSITPIANALNYIWTVPTGATIASGAGTTNITVDYSANAVTGNVTIYGNNLCGNGSSSSLSVGVGLLPGPGGPIAGPADVCKSASGMIYSVDIIPYTTGYNWTVPAGVTIVSGANTKAITVNFAENAVSGNITVFGSNPCGNGAVSPSFAITINPPPAAEAGDDREICPEASTQIGAAAVPGSSYSWTSVPPGFTSTLANPTVSPSVTTFYTVVETSTIGCTNSNIVVVSMNPVPAAAAGADRGICSNMSTQLGTTAVAGSTYQWTSNPAGFTSTLSNPTVTPAETTTYSVVETITATGCHNSNSVVVTLNPLVAAAGAINGQNLICPGGKGMIYSVDAITNATSYVWAVPTGATIVSGANTNSLSVDFATSGISGNFTVYGANSCGNGAVSPALTVSLNPVPPAKAGDDRTICQYTNTQIGADAIPSLITAVPTAILMKSATSGGSITSNGNVNITARGVCYSTSANPTIADLHTTDGTGNGSFESKLVNLTPKTKYYIKAYATNAIGTGYGNETIFKTDSVFRCGNMLTDERDGKVYPTVQIGDQCWFAKNLNVGTRIDAKNIQENHNAIEKYCFTNDEAVCNDFGGLYMWDNMMQWTQKDSAQGICPQGWHIPSIKEYDKLTAYLGGKDIAGARIKSTVSWYQPNVGANNSSGFSGLGGGYVSRYIDPINGPGANFLGKHSHGRFWTSSSTDKATRYYYEALNNTGTFQYGWDTWGNVLSNSVRCILNTTSSANYSPEFSEIENESEVQMDRPASGNATSTFSWSSNPAGFTSTEASPFVSPQVTTTYTVVETFTATGCTNTHSMKVTVTPAPVTPVVTASGNKLTSNAPIGNQWYYAFTTTESGSPVPYAVLPTHPAAKDGLYWTVVTLNGCSSLASNKQYVKVVGIEEELPEAKLVVSPVPNAGRFTASITSISPQTFGLQIYNNSGQMIYEIRDMKVDGKLEQVIDLRPAPAGIYILILHNGNSIIHRKILISN
ncbi:MAG: FISUMP domain-containing protein [Bacteroidota bacterium]